MTTNKMKESIMKRGELIGLDVKFDGNSLSEVTITDKTTFGLYICKDTGEYPSDDEMQSIIKQVKEHFTGLFEAMSAINILSENTDKD